MEQIWHRLGPDEKQTDSLHSIISTPYMAGDYVYGVDSYGELRCLDAKTGNRDLGKPGSRAQGSLGHDPHGAQWPTRFGCLTIGAS